MRGRNVKPGQRAAEGAAVGAPAAAAAVPQPAVAAGIRRAELPRLELLRSFEAAARLRSITRAGAELALTQSAVSRQIQQLEQGLGVPLFERRHRAIVLTEAGRVMLRAVDDCLQRLRDATTAVRAGAQGRRIAVTTTPGFASLWLIPRLARFAADHPGVDVRVSATLEALDLERQQVDVAVRFLPLGGGPGEPLFEESMLPVCAPQLLRDRSRPLRTPADLARHTLLAMEMPQATTPTADWSPWFRVMGLPEMRVRSTLRFTHYADAVAAAVAGQGVAIGRLPLVARLLRERRLVAPFKDASSSQRAYYVLASPQARHNPDAQDFVAWLRREALVPDGA